jgi:hypothetical protein
MQGCLGHHLGGVRVHDRREGCSVGARRERALGADPLADLAARDYAARDFKRLLKSERALGPASVNLALAAV